MISSVKKGSMVFSSQLFNIPTPISISYAWNFGSLLGMCLLMQILSGLFLAMQYESSIYGSFMSVVSICNNVNWGWVIRTIHANGASAFFIFIYLHIGRGIYYSSYNMLHTWSVGVSILLILMATAFLGYVLPWGQMSFWGATVITNLVSAIPYVGSMAVIWLWGGFSVGGPTLTRFFAIHYILPFIILFLVIIHLLFLHTSGSSNILGIPSNSDKVFFHPYFSVKDFVGFVFCFILFIIFVILFPDTFMDPDNFSLANPMSTPPHIQPEWYFLFAYAILRSIPNKLGGVVALLMSIMILLVIPLISSKSLSCRFSPFMKMMYWFQVFNFMFLTWLGAMPVESPFVFIGQIISVLYFIIMLLISLNLF